MRIAFTGDLAELAPEAQAALLARRDVSAETPGAPSDVPPGAGARVAAAPRGRPDDVAAATSRQVRDILARVRADGDAALFEMARELDGVELASLEVPRERWRAALDALDPDVRRALERAAANIERFHRAQLPPEAKGEGVEVEIEPGVVLGRRAVPLRAAGVYAPGGRAAYPSSVLMGVVPARAAGVEEIIVCSPPGPAGEPPLEVLAACAIAGATRLFSVGGAGAIGALAFGTASVPRVDAVVGPGNRWVTEAKRQVAGRVIIDSPAGPSEVLLVAQGADGQGAAAARARTATLVALELVAQAEHDPDAAAAFVTDSGPLLAAVASALEREVARAPRRAVVEAALAARGALLRAPTWDAALDFAQTYAAEHLVLLSREPGRDLPRMTTSGTVFVGEPSSVAFGDYMTGANHVLPTEGLARALSGLSTLHFLRFFTWQALTAQAAGAMSAATACLAEAEGLPGHAAAARARALPETLTGPGPEARLDPGPEARLDPGPEARLDPGPEARLESGPEARSEAGREARPEERP